MKEELRKHLKEILADIDKKAGMGDSFIIPSLDYPESPEHGDYSSNVAMVNAKKLGIAPKVLAQNILNELEKNKPDFLEKVKIAGPGFINFFVKDKAVAREIIKTVEIGDSYGRSTVEKGRQVVVEYTDPNPFKVIHIGHLMSNAIGESVARLIEYNGAEVKRANWQGDVGPHVAKAIWGSTNISVEVGESAAAFWGRAYVFGSTAYEADLEKKKEINFINKKVYDRSDSEINAIYDKGRQECLDAFEIVYKRLGTKFDNYFFEGKEGRNGQKIVEDFLAKGIFEKSDGAVVFKGENYGLHTRVFITSQGLPTYETKELGLNKEKFTIYPDLSESIIFTGNEQSDYFKVLLAVMKLIYPEIAEKTKHIPHGMLRFASGKMSSRKGNVISAEALIDDIRNLVKDKISTRGFDAKEADEISDIIAIGAIKYTILRQSIGGDVVFDSSASISFEGDSGPYLQYSAVRAHSILSKATEEGITNDQLSITTTSLGKAELRSAGNDQVKTPEKATLLEKLIIRFPDIVERARYEYAPQIVANYLINLAGAFNSFYASQVIVDKKNELSPYYVLITKAFLTTMINGLWLLGIKVPEKM